jgi:hypothetical protein
MPVINFILISQDNHSIILVGITWNYIDSSDFYRTRDRSRDLLRNLGEYSDVCAKCVTINLLLFSSSAYYVPTAGAQAFLMDYT